MLRQSSSGWVLGTTPAPKISLRHQTKEELPVLSPTSQSHPHPDQLQRFMTNKLSPPEATWILRHLLKGCPKCCRVTGLLWILGEREPVSVESGL
jgi:hypothetical protein